MVHLSLGDVFVRVDDLDARERARVAAVKRLIAAVSIREGQHILFGLIAAIVVALGFLFGSLAFGNSSPSGGYLFSAGVMILVAGVVATRRVGDSNRTQTEKDLFDLSTEVSVSPRCRELLDAYLEVHPWFGQFVPELSRAPRSI